MSYPIRLSDQLKQHLRALRKSHGLTQAQLGVAIGVKQARIAEIEAAPGAVSLDQLTKILAALGATFHLHVADTSGPTKTRIASPTPGTRQKSLVRSPTLVPRRADPASKRAPRAGVVIPAKKGAW